METKIGAMWPQTKECQQPPESGRGKEQILPSGLGGSMALPMPRLGCIISDFRRLGSKTVKEYNFSYFKPPCVCQDVTSTTGKRIQHNYYFHYHSIIDSLGSICLLFLLPELIFRHQEIIILLSVQLEYSVCAIVNTISLEHFQDG